MNHTKKLAPIKFATFWHGPALSPYEEACLYSFVHHGYEVSLYSYEPIENLPKWLKAKDAATIAPRTNLKSFPVNDKPSIAHFSDYFRCMMFSKTDEVWIDTDIVLLRKIDFPTDGNVYGRDTSTGVCNAILHLNPADSRLQTTLNRLEGMMHKPQPYAATGPVLIRDVYGLPDAMPPSAFFPIIYQDYYKVFHPRYLKECEDNCRPAYTLHLWNDLVVKMGLLKLGGPPAGSFLHKLFEEYGANKFFPVTYPANVIDNLIYNAVTKVDASAGIKGITRLLRPVLKRVLSRKLRRLKAKLKKLR